MKNGFNILVIIRKEANYDVWCDASIHGHLTNNYSELNDSIFKDIVLSRYKSYKAVILVDFIYTSLEKYYFRPLRIFVNGRSDTARHLFEDQLKRAININEDFIKQSSQNMNKGQSGTENIFYEVDIKN